MWMAEHPRALRHTAGFGIGSTVIKPRDAGVADGGGAHWAGFKCHIEIAPRKTLLPQCRTGRANDLHLCMGGGVIEFPGAVAILRNHLPRFDDASAHGHLAPVSGHLRLRQSDIHETAKRHVLHMHANPGYGKAMNTDTPQGDRIAKVLSRAGIASRREAERMIADGRISVNGKVIDSPALNVTPTDKITADGKPVGEPEPARIWLYHKPAGLVTTERDEKDRPTVFASLPEDMPRVMSVGRLDLSSEGLLLLTNDGEVKRRLELPSTGWLRRYRVRIKGSASEAKLDQLREGITVEGLTYQPMVVTFDRQVGANAWLTISLREGKNREIRRAMEAIGATVNRLIRVSYGPFQLNDLKAGEVEEVKRRVVRDQLGIDQRPKPERKRKTPQTGKKRLR